MRKKEEKSEQTLCGYTFTFHRICFCSNFVQVVCCRHSFRFYLFWFFLNMKLLLTMSDSHWQIFPISCCYSNAFVVGVWKREEGKKVTCASHRWKSVWFCFPFPSFSSPQTRSIFNNSGTIPIEKQMISYFKNEQVEAKRERKTNEPIVKRSNIIRERNIFGWDGNELPNI